MMYIRITYAAWISALHAEKIWLICSAEKDSLVKPDDPGRMDSGGFVCVCVCPFNLSQL